MVCVLLSSPRLWNILFNSFCEQEHEYEDNDNLFSLAHLAVYKVRKKFVDKGCKLLTEYCGG